MAEHKQSGIIFLSRTAYEGDIINFRGPMTGIFSALTCTGVKELFVAACDMPFIADMTIKLIQYSYNRQDAVIPVFNGSTQPLPGVYSGNIMALMEERIILKTGR